MKVYPRAYGETAVSSPWSARASGLPPCIRGNRDVQADLAVDQGSTPVHTGKPQSSPN